ncbi:MAG: single-stranded-DNA-specific exonuclease RecJ [Blastocatellia bacterium]|nr:single-stranded-DNA-specific exonuclease RecJ [Blastocatellia bacterium]
MAQTPPQQISGTSLSGTRWQLADSEPSLVQQLHHETNESLLLVRCLYNRGIKSADAIRDFLSPSFTQHRHAPNLLRDMPQAVERIRLAVNQRERLLIVTDFDVDGTTSSVILSNTLRLIGGDHERISCYVPDRFSEGYGLSAQIVEKAVNEGVSVILTADIGIKSHAEARLARQHGIDLIICDHHLPDGEDVPADAFAVLCPKGSSGTNYPNKDLAACGVALKLADALLSDHPKREPYLASLAKLAAIGSIADMVDVSNAENRAIIKFGLTALGQPSNNPGLRALLQIAQVNDPVTTYDVGFKLGPRINAAGRIAHANTVLSLFAARNDAEALAIAHDLDKLNTERQQIQQNLVNKIIAEVEEKPSLDRVLVFSGHEAEGYHRGVVGIVCSKLVERTGRPTLACAINEEGVAHGSARSIRGFHIVEAMQASSDILVKFGGHPMAAGFTIRADRIEEFRYRLNQYAAEVFQGQEMARTLVADAELRLDDLTPQMIHSLARMEPHGIGNPSPVFLLRNVPLRSITVLKEKHLKLFLGSYKKTVEAVWWQAAQFQSQLTHADEISLLCRPELNEWKGRTTLQLKVVDIAL